VILENFTNCLSQYSFRSENFNDCINERMNIFFVGFEVLTAVVMKSTIF
jgi:hypothetical protein